MHPRACSRLCFHSPQGSILEQTLNIYPIFVYTKRNHGFHAIVNGTPNSTVVPTRAMLTNSASLFWFQTKAKLIKNALKVVEREGTRLRAIRIVESHAAENRLKKLTITHSTFNLKADGNFNGR